MRTRGALIAVLVLAAACARGPGALRVPAPAAARPVDVDALIRRGCYRCLESAFHAAVAAGTAAKAAEAALLLTARSKELGLPPRPWLGLALDHLPPGPEWAAYFDIVNTLPIDPLSGDRDEVLAEDLNRRRPREVWDRWREGLKTGAGSLLLRAYLDLSIVCRRDIIARPVDGDAREAAAAAALRRFHDVPLLRYRAALCGGRDFDHIAAVREADPDFVDADLELGRRALQNRVPPDVAEALPRLRSARAAFPTSPVVPVMLGNLHEGREEWPEALAEYEAALALVDTHRDALLGQTVSLSQLDRYEEALASANRLLELGNWFTGAAYFWRAWNAYQLHQNDAARADADRAKAMMVNPPLLVLSGMIEWRQARLESAEQEFQRALELDDAQCDAAFYLGSVRWERRLWPDSLAAFVGAGECLTQAIASRLDEVVKLSATPELAAANIRRIASHEQAIADLDRRRGEAAQNAASIQKILAPAGGR